MPQSILTHCWFVNNLRCLTPFPFNNLFAGPCRGRVHLGSIFQTTPFLIFYKDSTILFISTLYCLETDFCHFELWNCWRTGFFFRCKQETFYCYWSLSCNLTSKQVLFLYNISVDTNNRKYVLNLQQFLHLWTSILTEYTLRSVFLTNYSPKILYWLLCSFDSAVVEFEEKPEDEFPQ